MAVNDDVALVVALAAELQRELRAGIVGRKLADGEEDLIGIEVHPVAELETVNRLPFTDDAQNRFRQDRNVQRVELLAVLRQTESGRLAIRADDEVARPRR